MKTNKEIKPFKMRCSKAEIIKVTNTLDNLGISKYRCSLYDAERPAIVFSQEINEYGLLNYIHFNAYSGDELTYSEFMKLYGEEEEVFTREDMDSAMNWAIKTYAIATDWTKQDKYELLTKYLSERTND